MPPDRSIRLACQECDRDDYDGISPAELAQAANDGWEEIGGPYADEWPDDDDLGWWTHCGTCPECAAAARRPVQGTLF